MRDIAQLSVTQVRIFPIDAIPMGSLLTRMAKDRLKKTFAFAEKGPLDDFPIPVQPKALAFRGGTVKVGKVLVVVERLEIDGRRVILQVGGSSEIANAVYKRIARVLGEFDGDRTFAQAKPVFLTEETTCLATLDFDFERLFAPQLLDLLRQKVASLLSHPSARATCSPTKMGVPVQYEVTSEELTKQQVTVADKLFTLEPRAGVTAEERRYFTRSPSDSKTHLRILEEFELAFRNSG